MKELFNKIQNWFASIPNDAHLHFEFSLFIAFIISAICQRCFTLDLSMSAIIGAITSLAVGVFKEVCIDLLWRKGFVGFRDLKNDFIGAITGAAISLV